MSASDLAVALLSVSPVLLLFAFELRPRRWLRRWARRVRHDYQLRRMARRVQPRRGRLGFDRRLRRVK